MKHTRDRIGVDAPARELIRVKLPHPNDVLDPLRLREAVEHVNVVVVHCTVPAGEEHGAYFIHRATFLIDHQARRKYPLLHAVGIGHEDADNDLVKKRGQPLHFTLYFTGLLKECTVFDLVERPTDLFPFSVRNIQRNAQDVYRVTLYEQKSNNQQPNTH